MNGMKKQQLKDSDINTVDTRDKLVNLVNSSKTSTVALALAITAGTGTLNSCTDTKDCDSDQTVYADPTDSANYDSMDTADIAGYDFARFADLKKCD
jgi:hypothetical protein